MMGFHHISQLNNVLLCICVIFSFFIHQRLLVVSTGSKAAVSTEDSCLPNVWASFPCMCIPRNATVSAYVDLYFCLEGVLFGSWLY